MKITLLGTGTSTGIPVIGCSCSVCTSTDKRDHRLRTSCLIEIGEKRILIDCGPDLRQQLLRLPWAPIAAILITHEHADHVGGIDDLRPNNIFGSVPLYANAVTLDHLHERFPYCFAQHPYPGVPQITLHQVTPGIPFTVADYEILPILGYHGEMPILGFRLGNFAYLTDIKYLPSSSIEALRGITHLVINGLRHKPHPAHQTISEACNIALQLHVQQAYITHLSHDTAPHAEEDSLLPPHIAIGYDGLSFLVS